MCAGNPHGIARNPARNDLRRDKFFAGCDAAAVTVEAGARFPDRKWAAHRLGQVVRGDYLVAGRDRESIGAGKVAHEAFEEVTVFLKHPRLRTLPKIHWIGTVSVPVPSETVYVLCPFLVWTVYV